ncbi:FAD-dependent monooxygenase [Mesorhizobium sp. M2D.F.Ca.ET.185.01.1.1]|uniref:FAD-dependent oxidoreductase n=1 Tax=unclassified Mesorhizobium TaxID=325217 RepID=UPI000FCAF89F|nr:MULTISPECIES: NAD(P)/FAD-dependent oxidoreductase [unclassified Mesorhizobium]TGP49233.1 FAD-dependent monooxygenase [bacterium M00.F.Ca.ET.230.01.1.1]TGP80327.1 FAD-dependent monooxygenase [bacterium M00.F.Ca.ET.227.01.1.1]TGQ00703.1 FAD-dependent monooxygenase [bacterium M00.F.Ca.ET.221.01.1.1]TGQ02775.1 FAD-dependent monooxygenase [bacterium M00.F.Ca.ET.222.01.1.1]TGT74549.1 FAD-dependent monooxygenase [bacterium M00.F.Ca.ET.159.01.1.1]TGT86799.1 FAD-dependent monooxygenase [bacterium M
MSKFHDIAIAGAGPAGLAAALYLKRAGHKVTIFERFDEPKPVGSGLILQPTGLTVLADLGLLDEMLSLGSRIERLHGTDARSGRTVLEVRYDARRGRRFGLAVHRAALFGVLYRAALRSAIAIETNVEVETLETGERATLVCGNGKRLGPFDLIIDASGARSKLRQYLGDAAMPRPLAYGAFWASLAWRDGFDKSALLQRYDKASIMVGVLPIGRPEPGAQDMAAFFWSLKPADAERVMAKGLEAWKAAVVSVWPQCEAFTSQIDNFEQLSLARYGHHTMTLPAGRRLAVIGDAAHSTSPQLGQGANMALLDAAALSHALAKANGVDQALEIYVRARRWHVRVFQALSSSLTPFYQSDSVTLPFVRDRMVAALARIPPGPQFLAAMVAGTVIDPFRRIGLAELQWPEAG